MLSEVTHLRRSQKGPVPQPHLQWVTVHRCWFLHRQQGGCVEDQTPAQPHAVMKCLLMTQALQGSPEGNPLLLFKGCLVQRMGEKIINVQVKWSSPTYYLPYHGLLEGALHRCKVLGRCSSHDHFYPPCSLSQESQEVPGCLLPLLNSFQGNRSAFKLKGCLYHWSPAMQILLANTVNCLSTCGPMGFITLLSFQVLCQRAFSSWTPQFLSCPTRTGTLPVQKL